MSPERTVSKLALTAGRKTLLLETQRNSANCQPTRERVRFKSFICVPPASRQPLHFLRQRLVRICQPVYAPQQPCTRSCTPRTNDTRGRGFCVTHSPSGMCPHRPACQDIQRSLINGRTGNAATKSALRNDSHHPSALDPRLFETLHPCLEHKIYISLSGLKGGGLRGKKGSIFLTDKVNGAKRST